MDIKKLYGIILMSVAHMYGKDIAKKFDTLLRFRRTINLKAPENLRDKVIFLEHNEPYTLKAKCTDKWDVREYVTSKGLEEILVPVYGNSYSNVEEIPFEDFPNSFVLKATHGCKMNYFCKDKQQFDTNKCKKILKDWLETTYGTYSGEWHYLEIPHRIYCEKYLDDADKMIDYKFHCMNGIPQYVLICGNRKVSYIGNLIDRHIYDMDWNLLQATPEITNDDVIKPTHFDYMVEIAKILSKDFKFVRVDLYEIEGKVYFGELTFTPTAGVFSHYTDEFLVKMGKKLSL